VLVCLAAAGVMLPRQIEDVKNQLGAPPEPPANIPPMTPLNVAPLVAAIQQLTNPPALVLSGDHNLFNPVVWKRLPNGGLLKVLKTGADALTITNITALYQRIAWTIPAAKFSLCLPRNNPAAGAANTPSSTKNPSPASMSFALSKDRPTIYRNSNCNWKFWTLARKYGSLRIDPSSVWTGISLICAMTRKRCRCPRKHVNDTFTLDGQMYKIVAITNGAVTVQQSATPSKQLSNGTATPGPPLPHKPIVI